jgi:RimJ/RimL family protein N-acetyltransferase
MASVTTRLLTAADAVAYKALRDRSLAAYPEAFGSDAETEVVRPATSYLDRLVAGGTGFSLGAFDDRELVGALTLRRESRAKTRHVAELVGMMVDTRAQRRGIATQLLHECIAQARADATIGQLILTVTASNQAALAVYLRVGFASYGVLPDAVRVGARPLAKSYLRLPLDR